MLLRHALATSSIAMAALSHVGHAQSATQVVRFQVNAINQVSVSGTTYALTTNEANQKIIASLDQSLPSGLTLEVNLAAPAGASSAGHVSLGTGGADVVTGISATSASALQITYRLSANPTVQVTPPNSRTVTFTIVSGT